MKKFRRVAEFFLNVPRSGTYRVGEADISYEIYRAEGISRAEGTKNTVQNDKAISSSSQNNPLPLAGGGGVGSQRPSEVFRTQTKSREILPIDKGALCERAERMSKSHPGSGWLYSFQNVGGAPPF